MPSPLIRQYVTFPIDWLEKLQTIPSLEWIVDMLHRRYPQLVEVSYEAAGYPTDDWKLCMPRVPSSISDGATPSAVAALTFGSVDQLDKFRTIVKGLNLGMSVGSSPGAGLADHWCPLGGGQDTFGTRSDAMRQIYADALDEADLKGRGVNVVIVDRGLDKSRLPEGTDFGGGWCHRPNISAPWREPGTTTGEDAQHAMMIARNVLALAPRARLYDLPVIPPRALNIPLFLETIEAAFGRLLSDIQHLKGLKSEWTDRWVLVNAWAVFDCRSEHPPGEYSRGVADHLFKSMISKLASEGVDIVFCAGNCGQFGPDDRCGPLDFGPGHSILGASSYPDVLTVGAVRADGMPLGYSSQGPGQTKLAIEKPDLVAPSNFSETCDAAAKSTGTSAACAVAAGVVAALREKWGPKAVLPEQMRQLLTKPTGKGEWNYQTGFGVINARKTLEYMPPVV